MSMRTVCDSPVNSFAINQSAARLDRNHSVLLAVLVDKIGKKMI